MAGKIVVTGGSGRLGQHVIRELLDHGYEILSLDRVEPPAKLCPSSIADLKRYVANHIGVGIIHNICIDLEDTSRFRSVSVEKLFPHPEATLIFRRAKKLSAGEKKLIEFLQAVS
jgi:nucleoside-diphosphate-sugar epimerase